MYICTILLFSKKNVSVFIKFLGRKPGRKQTRNFFRVLFNNLFFLPRGWTFHVFIAQNFDEISWKSLVVAF